MLTFRLADGPLLGECLDHVVLRRSSARSSAARALMLGHCLCLVYAWLDCVGHGFVAGAWFLAALLTAALPLQVFVPPHRLFDQVTLSPVSRLWLVDLALVAL
jgi:hypothetical protein